jgi:NAD+ diphosphatase
VSIVDAAGEPTILDRRQIVMPDRADLALTDLRTIAAQGLVAPPLVGILGQAKSLMGWHARHRFCPNCGAPTRLAAAGWRRECDACKAQHFPRVDPVVIMLAVDGEYCLLGRQARFPKGMYSCLAGFLEAGETIEDAVRREILEESGIATGRVAYLASQPWPFPSSLMLGCLAQAITREVEIDRIELEDARWFSREEAAAMLAGRHPGGLSAPQKMAIAHHIVRAWAVEGASV